MKNTAMATVKEIKRRADFVLDGKQGADVVALRKALTIISSMAYAEITAGELPLKEKK